MKMDEKIGSVLDVKRSFIVNKSVKRLLNEFQGVYGEKLRRLEDEVKGSQEDILLIKVRILHSYVNDLSDQNEILVHTVEELEKEAEEKLSHLKEKLQTSEEGIKDSAHQRKRLEEDNTCLRAEIHKLKADTQTLTRVIHDAQQAHGPDVTGLILRPQTPESISERSSRSTRLSQKTSDFMKAQVQELRNQLKTKNRIIQHLEEEMKTRSSHTVQEKKNEGTRAVEALEQVCKPRAVQKRTHTHTEIHKTEDRLAAAQDRLQDTKGQLAELKKQYKQKQKEVEKLREETTKHEVLTKEKDEELQKEISERRNLELDLTVISEKQRMAQQEASSRDQVILKLRAELRVSLEKNQDVQEELGLQEAEVSRLNEKVRKQQAHLQELREMCRHGNAWMDQEEQKTQQLHSRLELAQQQLKRQVERVERLQEELTASRLDRTADAERWTQRNLLLHAEVQQLQEQNLQHTQLLREHAEKIREAERMQHLDQEKVEKEVALVRDELQNTHLSLQTRSEELQKVHEEMQRAFEEKNRKEKENEVLRNELKQLCHQLQQLLCFFADAADGVQEQEDSSAVFIPPSLRKQLNDSPKEKEDIPPPSQLQLTVEELRVEAGVCPRSLQEAADETETLRRLNCETARERDEAREQLQQLKQDLEETQAENTHLHREREQLVTNINLWITEHKAANESLAARIKQQNELLTSDSLERENKKKNRLEQKLRQIHAIQARLRGQHGVRRAAESTVEQHE